MTPARGLDEIHARIEAPSVRACCDRIIDAVGRHPEFETKFQTTDAKKAVHFLWRGKDVYAFIANAQHLRWYFRKLGVTAGLFSFEDAAKALPDAAYTQRKDPSNRELAWTIGTMAETERLLSFVDKTSRRS